MARRLTCRIRFTAAAFAAIALIFMGDLAIDAQDQCRNATVNGHRHIGSVSRLKDDEREAFYASLGASRDSIPYLMVGLHDRSPAVRYRAVRLLAQAKSDAVVAMPMLITRLADRGFRPERISDHVIDAIPIAADVADAIAEIGCHKQDSLSELEVVRIDRTRHPLVRIRCARAIVLLTERDGPSIDTLIGMCDHDSSSIRYAAVLALSDLGKLASRARSVLRMKLRDDDAAVQTLVVSALSAVGGYDLVTITEAVNLMPSAGFELWSELVVVVGRVIPCALGMQFAAFTIDGLSRFAHERYDSILPEAVGMLRNHLADDEIMRIIDNPNRAAIDKEPAISLKRKIEALLSKSKCNKCCGR